MTLAGLLSGFVLSILAIALWSKTRDRAWLMMALGAVFLFGDFILGLFEGMGLPVYRLIMISGISLIKILAALLPSICFSAGFIIFLIRKRWT
jgi:hypothetical protein